MQTRRRGLRPRQTVFLEERPLPGGREFLLRRRDAAAPDGLPTRAIQTARSFSWIQEAANDGDLAGGDDLAFFLASLKRVYRG